jgi:hypothetical protein
LERADQCFDFNLGEWTNVVFANKLMINKLIKYMREETHGDMIRRGICTSYRGNTSVETYKNQIRDEGVFI